MNIKKTVLVSAVAITLIACGGKATDRSEGAESVDTQTTEAAELPAPAEAPAREYQDVTLEELFEMGDCYYTEVWGDTDEVTFGGCQVDAAGLHVVTVAVFPNELYRELWSDEIESHGLEVDYFSDYLAAVAGYDIIDVWEFIDAIEQ